MVCRDGTARRSAAQRGGPIRLTDEPTIDRQTIHINFERRRKRGVVTTTASRRRKKRRSKSSSSPAAFGDCNEQVCLQTFWKPSRCSSRSSCVCECVRVCAGGWCTLFSSLKLLSKINLQIRPAYLTQTANIKHTVAEEDKQTGKQQTSQSSGCPIARSIDRNSVRSLKLGISTLACKQSDLNGSIEQYNSNIATDGSEYRQVSIPFSSKLSSRVDSSSGVIILVAGLRTA